MTRKTPASPWMRRHLRDPYVKQAARNGYRSRSAYKLIELDDRDRLLRPGMSVIDLGSSPGGWSQVAAERVTSSGRVVAVDVIAMNPVAGVTFILGDIRESGVQAKVREALGGQLADLVLGDMAPNLSGVGSVDEAHSQELAAVSMSCARLMLKRDGRLLVKLFHGSGLDAVIREFRKVFRDVAMRKPPASRSRSSEVYALCRGLLN